MIAIKQLKSVIDEIYHVMQDISVSSLNSWQKEDKSFVTNLDLQLQYTYIKIIKNHFPDHNILHEEGKPENMGNDSQYTWVIDPIDGTNNMVKGKNEFSSCLGLMEGNRFIAAVVYFPQFNEGYWALENGNVFKNDEQYSVPKDLDKSKEIILCSKSYNSLKERFISAGYEATCYYCATYSLLKLLKGEALLYHTKNTRLYDVGPMSFILEKAGIPSYNDNGDSISYRPSLDIIPFFVASTDKNQVIEFLKKI